MRSLFCCSLLLWFAASAWADGIYQRTKDGKTLVWNDSPRPGDAATWTGDRDDAGYATGFGTLTWYTARQQNGRPNETLYAYYFGNMVRGKLDGPVNGHSKGITNHALFTDGKRATRWTAGPIPSWTIPRSKIEKATEQLAAATVDKTKPAEFNPPPPSYETITSKRPMPNFSSLHQESPAAPQDVPAEGPGPAAIVREPADQPNASSSAQPKPKLEIDASLRSLTGPPPILRADSMELGPQAGSHPGERSSSSTVPLLSKQQAIGLADAQARRRGYDLSKYRRSDPQFDGTDNSWSLFYEKEHGDQAAPSAKHFTVAIDDKTKRTAIVAGQ